MKFEPRGSFVAIVTPMDEKGGVDHGALRDLVAWHAEEGTDGIVPCGTTGESATLTHHEHEEVISTVVEAARAAERETGRRMAVLAGTGSNATHEAVALTRAAAAAGADAVLVITPYYNKPTQGGMLRHFAEVAKASDLPMVLYNVPGRTAVSLAPDTVGRIAREIPSVVGIKEATGSVRQASEIHRLVPDLAIFSGDDFATQGLLACGAVGTISVTANLAPRLVKEHMEAWFAGEVERAREIHERLLPLAAACFAETNPIPVKYGVHRLGRCGEAIRLPLTPASPATRAAIDAALKDLGLLSERSARG